MLCGRLSTLDFAFYYTPTPFPTQFLTGLQETALLILYVFFPSPLPTQIIFWLDCVLGVKCSEMPFREPHLKTPWDRRTLRAGGLHSSLVALTFTLAGGAGALVLEKRRLGLAVRIPGFLGKTFDCRGRNGLECSEDS